MQRLDFIQIVTAGLVAALVSAGVQAGENLLDNPGFEDGLEAWSPLGGAGDLAISTAQAHGGNSSGLITGRTADWNGPAQDLRGRLEPGRLYRFSVRVRLRNAAKAPVRLFLSQEDDRPITFMGLARADATDRHWTHLIGHLRYDQEGELKTLNFYVAGPDPGVEYFVDDAEVAPLSDDWQAEAADRIDAIRKRNLIVRVVNEKGFVVSDAQVDFVQTRRHFPFGSLLNEGAIQNEPEYVDFATEFFDWMILQVFWPSTEPTQNNHHYATSDEVLAFAQTHDMKLRAHNVFWGQADNPQFATPAWALALEGQVLEDAMESRLVNLMAQYGGQVEHWDLLNEPVHQRFFEDELGSDIYEWMFERAKELDDDGRLFINDLFVGIGGDSENIWFWNDAGGFRMFLEETSAYKELITQLLEVGAPVEGIGIQGHVNVQHSVHPQVIWSRLDALAETGLPLWITEADAADADPVARADKLEAIYTAAFAHPAVEGIVMWDFWANTQWRGPNASIVNADFSLNTAGERFVAMMENWRTETTEQTDAFGRAQARVFHGDYQVTVSVPGVKGGVTKTVQVPPAGAPKEITIVVEAPAPGVPVDARMTAAWFDATRDGEGWLLQMIAPDTALIYWFTYSPDGSRQAWLFGVGAVDGNTIRFGEMFITSGGVFGPGFDPDSVSFDPWGELEFVFTSCNGGIMRYAGPPAFGSGELAVNRITEHAGLGCAQPAKTGFGSAISGAWFDPSHNGEGWLIDVLPGDLAVVYWFTYDDAGNQAWIASVGSVSDKTIIVDSSQITSGTAFGDGFDPEAVQREEWGTMTFTFEDCDSGSMSYASTRPAFGSGELALRRITAIQDDPC